MDTHCQDLGTVHAPETLSHPAIWDVAREGGDIYLVAYSSVQTSARNINFRQTVQVMRWVVEITAVFALGVFWQAFWLGQANVLGAVLPMALALMTLAYAARRLLQGADRHPLALRHASDGQAALGLAMAFAPFLLAHLPGGAAQIGWLLAWAVSSSLLAFGLGALVGWSGWGLTGGGVALLGRHDLTRRLAGNIADPGRCPVVACLQYHRDGDVSELRALVEHGRVETVVLVGIPADEIGAALNRIADLPVAIYVSQDAGATHLPIADVVELLPNLLVGQGGLAKRAVDLLGASAALLLSTPLLLLAALLIRLESPGPALFRQVRFGCGGRAMEVWKLRSMYLDQGDVTGETRTVAADPRVTRVGRVLRRLSIDELPQLINVLRGDMSLVGPRPHAVRMRVEGEYYHRIVAAYPVRHRVKPGITGWAQINGSRGEVDTLAKADRRISLDLWYISNWSLALDLRILALTAMGRFATLKAD